MIFRTDFLTDVLTVYDRFFGQIFDSFGGNYVSKYIKKGNLPKRLRTTDLAHRRGEPHGSGIETRTSISRILIESI